MNEQLCEEFKAVFVRFRRIRPHPITVPHPEIMVLKRVKCFENHSPAVSDIQDGFEFSRPAMSQTLNNLEKKGFIVRKIDEQDRRRVVVSIMPEGENVLDDIEQKLNKTLETVIERFGEKKSKEFIALFGELCDIFNDLEKGENTSDKTVENLS